MTTSDWILIINAAAILFAPIVALWVGGILQQRSTGYDRKLTLFGTLLGLRHDPLSGDSVKALNLIDSVFVNEPAVREAWTKYYTLLNDVGLNSNPGYAVREERRRDLLLEMVKALGLTNKISSADVLRAYAPTFVVETTQVGILERMYKRALYEEDLQRRGLAIPNLLPPMERAPMPPSPQSPAAPGGNGAQAPAE